MHMQHAYQVLALRMGRHAGQGIVWPHCSRQYGALVNLPAKVAHEIHKVGCLAPAPATHATCHVTAALQGTAWHRLAGPHAIGAADASVMRKLPLHELDSRTLIRIQCGILLLGGTTGHKRPLVRRCTCMRNVPARQWCRRTERCPTKTSCECGCRWPHIDPPMQPWACRSPPVASWPSAGQPAVRWSTRQHRPTASHCMGRRSPGSRPGQLATCGKQAHSYAEVG